MTKRLLTTVLFFLVATLHMAVAGAADIRPFIAGSGSYRAIVIEGNIEPGDFETFVRIVKENQGQVSGVYIFSLGGDFYEAMKIGRAMRALELSSQVPMRGLDGRPVCEDDGLGPKPRDPNNCTCASAGFFIHIGAIHRGGTYLAVHRPYFAKGKFGDLSQADAQKAFDVLQESARTYMQEMGVPKHIQEDVLGTPSERALVLDDKTVKTYFWLALPYRHEWKKNRCSKLSESEIQRLEEYSRLLRARSAAETGLSKAEWNDLSALQKKRDEEGRCDIEIEKQSRIEAYTRYFSVKPADYAEQDFSKWSDSAKYLGRQFYELQAEERFDEGEFLGSFFLERAATAKAPTIRLSDSLYRQKKVVARIGMASTPNPSPEYTRRLVQSLEGAWGNRSGGNGATEWLWDKKEFSANLTYEPVSAEGPLLRLVIESK